MALNWLNRQLTLAAYLTEVLPAATLSELFHPISIKSPSGISCHFDRQLHHSSTPRRYSRVGRLVLRTPAAASGGKTPPMGGRWANSTRSLRSEWRGVVQMTAKLGSRPV